MALKDVKKVKNVSWPVVGSVMAGIALFGFAAWGIKRLPSNSITEPVKRAANIASRS